MEYLRPPSLTHHQVSAVGIAEHHALPHTPLEYTVTFANNLNQPVTVISRNGIPFKLPASGSRDNNVVIRYTYTIAAGVEIDPVNVFHHNTPDSPEHQVFQAAIEACEKNSKYSTKRFSIDYVITRDEIVNKGGNLYVGELDLVVSVLDDREAVTHPYSDSNTRYQLIENEVNVNDLGRFGYAVYIISNDGGFSDRYINVNGDVYKVPAVKNHSLRDGIYICSSGTAATDASAPMPQTHRYSYEEGVERLRLFKTPEEAANFGDTFAEREREITEAQLNLKAAVQKHAARKAELERELTEKKHELEKIEATRKQMRDELDHERQLSQWRSKDFYEDRAIARKDSSEIIKFFPILIGGIFTLAAIYSKQSSK